jgi:hypothetical protein
MRTAFLILAAAAATAAPAAAERSAVHAQRGGALSFARFAGSTPTFSSDRHAGRSPLQPRRGRGNRGGRYGLVGGYWDGYAGEDPEAARSAGFFSGPALVRSDGRRALYDYDRGYPYDWYGEAGGAAEGPGEAVDAAAPLQARCSVSWVASGKGSRTPVRICRGG